jgi:hypothetical protein
VSDLEDRSEAARQRLGIDGTMGDAQDVPHPFTEDPQVPYCLVCGFSRAAAVHGG